MFGTFVSLFPSFQLQKLFIYTLYFFNDFDFYHSYDIHFGGQLLWMLHRLSCDVRVLQKWLMCALIVSTWKLPHKHITSRAREDSMAEEPHPPVRKTL